MSSAVVLLLLLGVASCGAAVCVALLAWSRLRPGSSSSPPPKTPPPPTDKSPDRTTHAPQGMVQHARCTRAEQSREPEGAEVPLFDMLRRRAKEFTDHVRTKYPSRPATQNLVANWNGDVMVSTKNTGATFYRGKCIAINPQYETLRNRQTGFDSESRLLTRVLHELAHSTSGPHDRKFYDTQRWFLRVATEELGWTLAVNCRVCCYYANGQCTPSGVCPKCTWLETACSQPSNCGDV